MRFNTENVVSGPEWSFHKITSTTVISESPLATRFHGAGAGDIFDDDIGDNINPNASDRLRQNKVLDLPRSLNIWETSKQNVAMHGSLQLKKKEDTHMSIKYFVSHSCESDNNNTARLYKRVGGEFGSWCKEHGISEKNVCIGTIQTFIDDIKEKYSVATVHSYAAPLCKAYGVNMSMIDKPRRVVSDITRGRSESVRGALDEKNEKYERLMSLQENVGIRRSELAKLTVNNLKYDESGHLCVEIKRGKGGKYQLQRVIDEKKVISVFNSSKSDKIFTTGEMNNHINLHGIRADVAKKAYDYYEKRLQSEPDYRKKLTMELNKRYEAFHRDSGKQREIFNNQLSGTYKLRGDSRKLAIEKGYRTEYDKLALMAVSVFHLSHWRLNVTVINYMLA